MTAEEIKVLEWYADRAADIARYNMEQNYKAIGAVIAELSLDAGRRGQKIIQEFISGNKPN